MAEPFHAISIETIQTFNREAIKRFGGLFIEKDGNLLHRNSLEYILEATLFPFHEAQYPSILEKISAIAHTILTRHVFHDGNKRTALAVIVGLTAINNLSFSPNQKDEDFIVRIATESLPIVHVTQWLAQRVTIPKQPSKTQSQIQEWIHKD